MRRKLLDATVDCLIEYGYSGTTTTRVADRAGVTRGAQVHHFHTKAELVIAAVRHLAERRSVLDAEQIERLRRAPDKIDAGLDLLWSVHQGPVFAATMELWTAARTDPELRAQLKQIEPAVTASIVERGSAIFPSFAEHTSFRHWVYTAMDTIRGLLVAEFIDADEQRLQLRWQRAKGHLRLAAEALAVEIGATPLTAPGGPTGGTPDAATPPASGRAAPR